MTAAERPEPAEPRGTVGISTGVVKFYKATKGWGAISDAATAPWDIWFSFSHVVGDFRSPPVEAGQRVEVEYERADQDSFRYRARSVRRLG